MIDFMGLDDHRREFMLGIKTMCVPASRNLIPLGLAPLSRSNLELRDLFLLLFLLVLFNFIFLSLGVGLETLSSVFYTERLLVAFIHTLLESFVACLSVHRLPSRTLWRGTARLIQRIINCFFLLSMTF